MKLSSTEEDLVKVIEDLLKIANYTNCNVCRILTHVCANHLFSDESDKCHISGIEFGQQINELGERSLK